MSNTVKSPDSPAKNRRCPYCRHEFPDPIKRKKKCPQCGHTILVRQGTPLTEEDATIYDWLQKIGWLGISRRAFDRERRALSERFGMRASVNDTLWSLLNGMVATKQGNDLQQLYYHMAEIVRSEGRDPNPFIQTAMRLLLEEYQREGIRKVQIFTANDDHVCPACQQLAEKIFTIQEALQTMPIPTRCSSQDGCRCRYAPVID